MSYNVNLRNLKTNYSSLFTGLSGKSTGGSGNFLGIDLTEYASIKSGAYESLLRKEHGEGKRQRFG